LARRVSVMLIPIEVENAKFIACFSRRTVGSSFFRCHSPG
jgi:hypothetical protein